MHLPRSKIQLSPPTTLRVGARKGAGRSGSSTYARRWKLPVKGSRVRVAIKGKRLSRIHLNATLTWIHLPDPLTRSAARPFSVDDFGERLRWTGGETLVFIRTRTPTPIPTPLFPSTAVHHPRATRRLPLQEVCRLPFFPCPPPFFRWTISFIFVQIIVPIVVSLDDNDRGRHQRSPPGKAHLLSSWRGRLCPALVPVARAHPPSARAW